MTRATANPVRHDIVFATPAWEQTLLAPPETGVRDGRRVPWEAGGIGQAGDGPVPFGKRPRAVGLPQAGRISLRHTCLVSLGRVILLVRGTPAVGLVRVH